MANATVAYRSSDGSISSRSKRDVPMKPKHIPRIRARNVMVVLDEEDENDAGVFSVKATLCEPKALSHQLFRVEQHNSALEIAHVINILAEVNHENVIQVYGMGDHFLVTSLWDESLKSLLGKISRANAQRKGKRGILFGKRNRPDPTPSGPSSSSPTFSLWQHVALPVTRALLHLHSQGYAVGLVSVDTIVVSGDGTRGPPQVYLRDFSKARQVVLMGDYDSSALLSTDVFQLGLVLNELARVQPLPPGPHANSMDRLIESCCHADAIWRPSIRRVHKRLLEIIRLLPLTNANVVPSEGFGLTPEEEKSQQTPRVPFLAGFRGVGTPFCSSSSSHSSPVKPAKTNSSLCPTENSSIFSDSNWTTFEPSSVQWSTTSSVTPSSPGSSSYGLAEC